MRSPQPASRESRPCLRRGLRRLLAVSAGWIVAGSGLLHRRMPAEVVVAGITAALGAAGRPIRHGPR
jgi:hypothetical protein